MIDLHKQLNHRIYSNLPPFVEEVQRVATSDEPKQQVVKITTSETSCRVSIQKKHESELPPLKYREYTFPEMNLQSHLAHIAVYLCLLKDPLSSNFRFHLIEREQSTLLASTITKVGDRICFLSEIQPPEMSNVPLNELPNIIIEEPYRGPFLVKQEIPVIYLGNFPIYLSRETQKGIAGKRDTCHHISPSLLKTCIRKKQTELLRALPGSRSTLYFLDAEKDRVLMLNFLIEKGFANLLTAFYVGDSAMKQRLRKASDTTYNAFKESITRV